MLTRHWAVSCPSRISTAPTGGAIRDDVKAIPKALEVSGRLGGEAFNGVLNLADEGATRAMRMWDRLRNDQLKLWWGAAITGLLAAGVSERYVRIPQGSKLIGAYSNQLIPSQQRLLVKWRKIVFPNGGELDLPDLTGTDAAGYAGFQDQVNHHYAKVWAPALLMSAISAGMMMSDYPMMAGGPYGCGGGYYMRAGQQLGQQALGHMATVQAAPTIQIRPGYHFRVLVTRDLVFSGPYGGDEEAQQ